MKSKKWFASGNDAMASVKSCYKLMRAWPENQTQWDRYSSYLYYPMYSAVMFPFMIFFIIMESKNAGVLAMLQGMSDTVGMATFILRGYHVVYLSEKVYRMCRLVTDEFKPFEKNRKTARLKPPFVAWCPSFTFLGVISASVLGCALSLLSGPNDRQPSIRLPKFVLQNDYIFYPLIIFFIIGHWPVLVTITSSDALIICSSTTLREKAETLKMIIRDLDQIKDNSERDAELKKIIMYHGLICKLHSHIEEVCNWTMLLQVLFLVISLGTPAARMLFTTVEAAELVFLGSYVSWLTTQLLVYCQLYDVATTACSSIGFAAYSAFRADMTSSESQKLQLIILRSARPLHLTARGIIKINRKMLLKLLRRSYSIYSAFLKLR